MSKIEYNPNTLNLINELSLINPSLIIDKDDGGLVIKSTSIDRSVAYLFQAPSNHFNFDGEECAFFNFSEFYKLFSVMDEPTIDQNSSDVVISKGRSTINYRLSPPDIITRGFNEVDFNDPDVTIPMTAEYIKKLYAFVSSNMLGADRLTIEAKDKELVFIMSNSKSRANTFSESIVLDEEVEEEFSIEISTTIFTNLPSGKDFQFSVIGAGIVQFKLITDTGVSLELYTGAVVEDD